MFKNKGVFKEIKMGTRTCGLGCGWYSSIGDGKGTCFNFDKSYSVSLGDPCLHGLEEKSQVESPYENTANGRARMATDFLALHNFRSTKPIPVVDFCHKS